MTTDQESNEGQSPSWPLWPSMAASAERKSEIRKLVSDSANFSPEYLAMNLLATVVAGYGLLQNSTAVVIGAMIIATLLGPINGLALALNDSNLSLLKRAGFAEAVGAGAVFTVSLFIGKMHANIPAGSEMLARTIPNIFDLVIALAGGAAGAYAVVSPKLRSGVVGVAIATALVPPLTTAGLLIARGGWENIQLGLGALLLFVTNLVTIQAAASAVFWIFGVHSPIRAAEKGYVGLLRRNWLSLVLVVLIGGFLTVTFQGTLQKDERNTKIRQTLAVLVQVKRPGSALADLNVKQGNDGYSAFAVVRTPVSFSPEEVADVEQGLSSAVGEKVHLYVRSVITKEASSQGWLHAGTDQPSGDTIQTTAFPGDTPESNPSGNDPVAQPSDEGKIKSPNPPAQTGGN